MRKSRLSSYKQDRLMEHFVAGATARMAARLVGVHRNPAALYFYRLREVIARQLEVENSTIFDGEVELAGYGTPIFKAFPPFLYPLRAISGLIHPFVIGETSA